MVLAIRWYQRLKCRGIVLEVSHDMTRSRHGLGCAFSNFRVAVFFPSTQTVPVTQYQGTANTIVQWIRRTPRGCNRPIDSAGRAIFRATLKRHGVSSAASDLEAEHVNH